MAKSKKDFVQNGLLFGLGLYSMSRDKVEKMVKRLEKNNHLSERQAKKLVADTAKEMMAREKKAKRMIEAEMKATAKKIALVTLRDLQALERKLKKFEKKK